MQPVGGRRYRERMSGPGRGAAGSKASAGTKNATDAEEARQRSEERLRTLLETLPVGVVITDETGRITQSNAAAERIWGHTPSLPIDQYVEYEGYWPDGRRVQSEEWALARAFQKGEVATGEVIRIMSFDGEQKTILNNGAPLHDADGKIFGAVVAFEDISEVVRIHDEQRFLADVGVALASSLDWEATLRKIAELAVPRLADWCSVDLVERDGIRSLAMVHTPSLRTTAETRRRYPASEVSNHPVMRAIQTNKPVLAPRFADLIDTFAHEPEYRRIVEGLGLHSYMVVPLAVGDRVLGALTFASGEHGRTFGAADLALAEELARRASLAVENARLYREAQEATRLRDNVLGVVSHDLKNPLNVLSLQCSLLKRRISTDAARESVAAMERSIRRMERMVTDLVDIAALEAGRLRINRRLQRPAQIVEEAVTNLLPLARESGVELSGHAAAELPAIACDSDRVLQVLGNLIGNAIKVTPEGGRIDVDVEAQGEEVVFTVRDTGCGISEQELPHIFERFWRGRDPGYRGTGLGLSIARSLVEAHAGRIWAESQPGAGSTFRFALPIGAE